MQGIRDGADKRQTDAGAAGLSGAGASGAVEFLPDFRQLLLRQTFTFIEHGQAHAVSGSCRRNLNVLALGRVADGVGQVIHQHLIEQITVRADRNMRVIIFHSQTSVFTQNSGFSHRFRTKCMQINILVERLLCTKLQP